MHKSCKYGLFAKNVHLFVITVVPLDTRLRHLYVYKQCMHVCMCMHALSHNKTHKLHYFFQFCFFVALMFTTEELSVDEGEHPILNLTYEANQTITSTECTGVNLMFFSGQ